MDDIDPPVTFFIPTLAMFQSILSSPAPATGTSHTSSNVRKMFPAIPFKLPKESERQTNYRSKACVLDTTISDASQWLTIDYESSLMQGLMTCTWGLMTDHYSAQKQ